MTVGWKDSVGDWQYDFGLAYFNLQDNSQLNSRDIWQVFAEVSPKEGWTFGKLTTTPYARLELAHAPGRDMFFEPTYLVGLRNKVPLTGTVALNLQLQASYRGDMGGIPGGMVYYAKVALPWNPTAVKGLTIAPTYERYQPNISGVPPSDVFSLSANYTF